MLKIKVLKKEIKSLEEQDLKLDEDFGQKAIATAKKKEELFASMTAEQTTLFRELMDCEIESSVAFTIWSKNYSKLDKLNRELNRLIKKSKINKLKTLLKK